MIKTQEIPLVDLRIQHAQIEEEVNVGIAGVLRHQGFILGPEVRAFETEFARYSGVGHVLGVGNGTDALELALRAVGIGRGDEVIVPANTFVATAEAVLRTGADIVLVDNDENYLIDVEHVGERLTRKTRAIMGVHLYGQTAPVERLREIAGPDVVIIEDAAQSQGARRHGIRAGSLGDIAGTSFYPGKNLGAYGDAGAVMTNSPEYAEAVAQLRNHGGQKRYEHNLVGMNSRMDSIQAVVLSAKLAHLDRWNTQRREAAAYYAHLFADDVRFVTPCVAEGNEHVFHLYVVRVPRAARNGVVEWMSRNGVGVGIHYPAPIHRLGAFQQLSDQGSFPLAEKFGEEILSLPIFPGITREQQDHVVEMLIAALRECA
ncbi:DegT/DnrJ/EryC1/StrS family aminotransferase [Cryobacterium sp. CG_9.6]|uniref:DegT/DnrJ/EryC1/StrS family aminotransferase n=1 Tax=Cryobacterium sp. CG_9.6 TaxID=2760710 RepID=UPI0024732048|nr:DegT/DnrJ/EryC1/StrS family aminotransferase [Cryobacterium sp. CG_9.6]MDH6238278.1 dTDP-4-amino-4,6-dideoxygalactose transaminase [Cryobacterium sp. CG_9.6]